jgi:hypothetical protein
MERGIAIVSLDVCCNPALVLLPFEAVAFGLATRVAVGIVGFRETGFAAAFVTDFVAGLAGLAEAFVAVATLDTGLGVPDLALVAVAFAGALPEPLLLVLLAADLVTVAFMVSLIK